MRIILPIAAALAFSASAAWSAVDFDGRYLGRSSTLGGTLAECRGGQPINASIKGRTIALRGKARDGTTRPGTGRISDAGTFVAIKRLNNGGIITYNGHVTERGITGRWKGPTCYGTFKLRR